MLLGASGGSWITELGTARDSGRDAGQDGHKKMNQNSDLLRGCNNADSSLLDTPGSSWMLLGASEGS